MKRLSMTTVTLTLVGLVIVLAGCPNTFQNDSDNGSEADTTPPGTVQNLVATSGDGEVTLSWTDPAAGDLASIDISWSADSGVTTTASISPGMESYTVRGLTNGIEVTFSVTAVDKVGNVSEAVRVSATPQVPSPGAPSEVSGLTASSGNAEISLSWTFISDTNLDHVEITWSPPDGESQPIVVSNTTETATITGLDNGTEYTFVVKTVSADANASSGVSVNAETQALAETQPPTFSSQGGIFATQTQLTMTAPDASAIVYYETDGSTPTTDSESFQIEKTVTLTTPTTVQAFAVDSDSPPSEMVSASFLQKAWEYEYEHTASREGPTGAVVTDVNGNIYEIEVNYTRTPRGTYDAVWSTVFSLKPDMSVRWTYDIRSDIDPGSTSSTVLDQLYHPRLGLSNNNIIVVQSDDWDTIRLNSLGQTTATTETPQDFLDRTYLSDGSYLVSDGNVARRLDTSDTLEWQYALSAQIDTLSVASETNDVAYFVVGSKLYCLSLDGNLRWIETLGSNIVGEPILDTSGDVIVAIESGSIVWLDQNGVDTGRLDLDYAPSGTPALAASGRLFVPTLRPGIVSVNNERAVEWGWEAPFPYQTVDSITITNGGRIVFRTRTGSPTAASLFLVDTFESGPAMTDWPQERRDQQQTGSY